MSKFLRFAGLLFMVFGMFSIFNAISSDNRTIVVSLGTFFLFHGALLLSGKLDN